LEATIISDSHWAIMRLPPTIGKPDSTSPQTPYHVLLPSSVSTDSPFEESMLTEDGSMHPDWFAGMEHDEDGLFRAPELGESEQGSSLEHELVLYSIGHQYCYKHAEVFAVQCQLCCQRCCWKCVKEARQD
jgi:hypothetical protein